MGQGKDCKTGCSGSGGDYELGVCRCCELLESDTKQRLVKFCSICSVYLCRQCFKKPWRRIKAFGYDIMEKIIG